MDLVELWKREQSAHWQDVAADIRRRQSSVRFMCKACNGTGHSRYREYDDCDVCDGHGTILSTLTRS